MPASALVASKIVPAIVAGFAPAGLLVIDQVPASVVICSANKSVVPPSLQRGSATPNSKEGHSHELIVTVTLVEAFGQGAVPLTV